MSNNKTKEWVVIDGDCNDLSQHWLSLDEAKLIARLRIEEGYEEVGIYNLKDDCGADLNFEYKEEDKDVAINIQSSL